MKTNNENYPNEVTEARMQAALRGARRVGPQPKASMTPKRSAKKRKRATKGRASSAGA